MNGMYHSYTFVCQRKGCYETRTIAPLKDDPAGIITEQEAIAKMKSERWTLDPFTGWVCAWCNMKAQSNDRMAYLEQTMTPEEKEASQLFVDLSARTTDTRYKAKKKDKEG